MVEIWLRNVAKWAKKMAILMDFEPNGPKYARPPPGTSQRNMYFFGLILILFLQKYMFMYFPVHIYKIQSHPPNLEHV